MKLFHRAVRRVYVPTWFVNVLTEDVALLSTVVPQELRLFQPHPAAACRYITDIFDIKLLLFNYIKKTMTKRLQTIGRTDYKSAALLFAVIIINVLCHKNAIRKRPHSLYHTKAVLDGSQLSKMLSGDTWQFCLFTLVGCRPTSWRQLLIMKIHSSPC